MLAIIIPMNVFLFGGLIILAFLAGFFLRSSQLKKFKKKVLELENEMLSNHADILELQKEKSSLEQKLKENHIPVIPISSKDEGNPKVQDISKRKIQAGGSSQH